MNPRGSIAVGLLAGVAAVVAVVAVALMAVLGVGVFQRSTANFRGRTGAIEKTRGNGDYRVAQYDWFFSQCGAVQAQEDRIKIFTPDTSPTGTANLSAVEATRASLIREYNAKAAATGTSGQFRASDLPFQIDPNQKDTSCASQ